MSDGRVLLLELEDSSLQFSAEPYKVIFCKVNMKMIIILEICFGVSSIHRHTHKNQVHVPSLCHPYLLVLVWEGGSRIPHPPPIWEFQ